ncbi:class I SAM-dependent methyltransferase [Methylobacterium sp. Leaf88]|uniref:class I SAM-dependent methyltransferase n=1 Tax=Methylobacterium sp. Leaf88 TaxID=1736244 RepID=UPI0009E9C353|nr:class I SAM-dependent methyltransferase [Methylobacterium sp. Leaf88]
MASYSQIYDEVFSNHTGYQSPIGSPGFRLCLQNQKRIQQLGQKSLDYGCGAGFTVELLRSHLFQKEAFGADISPKMVAAGNARIGMDAVKVISNGRAPYEDNSFDFITCFDVLEHLDEADILNVEKEFRRLIKPGGTVFCNISLRLAGSVDLDGRNLHRTVQAPDWWDKIFAFDEFTVEKSDMEMTGWKRM